MSDTIKGLSIDLDLQTIKAERGLTGLKDRLKTVNTEMRSNMSAFDRSDQSIGKYEKRLEGLNKKLEVQQKVTQESEAHYKKMVETHGEGSKQAEKAAQEFNKQSAELNDLARYTEGARKELEALKEQQRIANSSWTKTGDALDKAGKKMSATGDKLQSFGKAWTKGVLAIGGAAVGAGASLFALTNKVTENADSIAKNSKRMGVSTDFYQEMDYWASQNGISQDKMEGALKRLNQRIGQAADGNEKYSGALEKLGVNMEGVRDGTVSTEDAFAQSIQSLSEMTNEQEKSALAAELFGSKMAQDLMPALQDGSLTIDEAKKKAEELGIVMGEDQLKAAEKFQDSQDDIKRSMGGIVNTIGLELMPQFQKMLDWVLANLPEIRETIQRAIDQVIERIGVFMKWWRELSDGAKRWIAIAAAVAVAIGPLAIGFGTMLKVLGPIVSTFGKLSIWIGKVGGLMPALKIAFVSLTGPVGITVAIIAALAAGFILAYKNSETFREKVALAIEGAKDVFAKVVEVIRGLVSNVVDYFVKFGESLSQFWIENGKSISDAISNIMNFVTSFLSGLLTVAGKFMPLISLVFKNALVTIEGIFKLGTNTIMGIIQIFAGIFTGDMTKMMEGIKRVFSGGFQIIWDFVKTFVKNIVQGFHDLYMTLVGNSIVPDMVRAIIDWFMNLGKRAVELVSSLVSKTVSFFTDLRKKAVDLILNMVRDALSNITNLRDSFLSRIRELKDNSIRNLSLLRDTFFSIGTNLRDGITERITKMKNNTLDRITDMRREAVSRFNVMKDRFFDVGRDIRDNLKSRFDDMVEAARKLPERIGTGIKNMASKAKDGVKSFANTIGSTLETGVNNVVGGMNKLLGKMKVSLTIPEISIPQYAKGTKNHPGGMAVVGEEGRELAHLPGKGYTILGEKGAELLNLPRGSSVLPNKETERLLIDGMGLPGYKSGVGKAFDWVKGKAKKGWESSKNLVLDAAEWLADSPKKLFDNVLKLIGVTTPSASDFPGAIMRSGFTALRSAVEEKLLGVQDQVAPMGSPTFGSGFRMTSPFGWRTHPVTGVRKHHDGVDYAAKSGTPFYSQSTGKVTFSGVMGGLGNAVRVKSGIFDHIYGHNLRNSVRTGQAVTKGQLLGLVGSTGLSTGPHVHYEIRKNGTPFNPRGFKTGGLIKEKMMAMLGDGGFPEYVIPTDPSRASEAMKLLALAGQDIESRGGAMRPHQLPTPAGSRMEEYFERMIDKLTEQLEDTKEIVAILLEILAKDNRPIIDALGLEKIVTDRQQRKAGRKERKPRG